MCGDFGCRTFLFIKCKISICAKQKTQAITFVLKQWLVFYLIVHYALFQSIFSIFIISLLPDTPLVLPPVIKSVSPFCRLSAFLAELTAE